MCACLPPSLPGYSRVYGVRVSTARDVNSSGSSIAAVAHHPTSQDDHDGVARHAFAGFVDGDDAVLPPVCVQRTGRFLAALLIREGDFTLDGHACIRPRAGGAFATLDLVRRNLADRKAALLVSTGSFQSRKTQPSPWCGASSVPDRKPPYLSSLTVLVFGVIIKQIGSNAAFDASNATFEALSAAFQA